MTGSTALMLLAFACGRTPGGAIDGQPLTAWVGDGWAIAVPEGARTSAEPDALRIDAADGTRWYDIRWTTEDFDVATGTWAATFCDTHQWDRLARPTERVITRGGHCNVGWRRQWLITVAETRGDRVLLTLYGADANRVTFEDAWVDVTRTALTLAAGDRPFEGGVPPEEIRRRAREAVRSGGVGRQLIPGGGELSARIAEALADLFRRRESVAAPERFVR